MPLKNLMIITSYYNLTYAEREQVLLAISKPSAFFKTFFNNLPYAKTKTECFNQLNDLHFDIYAEYMYTDYRSFQIVYSRFTKNNRK